MNDNWKVSIITTTFNDAAHLRQIMEQVLRQTYENIEYIVVDGASKDGTIDLLKEMEPAFGGRLRWISEPDAGIYNAINKGVRLATYAARCVENEILMYFRSLKKSSGDISLSEALDTDSEGNSLSLMDVLSEPDDMAERVSLKEACIRLRECVSTALEPREAEVIRLRYGLDGREALTQRDTAARLGISRSYVSRIEKRALERLREAMAE